MRPTPDETIAGIHRVLRNTVAAHLDSSYVRGLVAQIAVTLAQYSWNDIHTGMIAENGDLGRFLARWLQAAERGSLGSSCPTATRRQVTAAIAEVEPEIRDALSLDDVGFASVHARNLACRAALEAAVLHTDWWSADGTSERDELRKELLGQLRSHPGGGYWNRGVGAVKPRTRPEAVATASEG